MNSQLIRTCQQITLTITVNRGTNRTHYLNSRSATLIYFENNNHFEEFAELNLSHMWYGHFRVFC